MRRIRKLLLSGFTMLLSAAMLVGCGIERTEIETLEEQQAQELVLPAWVQTYSVSEATVAEADEAVLFQQKCEGGFLAYINRKVRENVPEELKKDPAFVNDGRYDVFESALFSISKSGKRSKVRRYRTISAPENTEELEKYFSESRPRAFRVREDGCIVALESSYESWLSTEGTQVRNQYYVRLLRSNGVEISSKAIETDSSSGLDCGKAVLLSEKLLAAPQGNEVLFFELDGKKTFSVLTPFPIDELCRTKDGKLAVVLNDAGRKWLSVIDAAVRSASVPQPLPEDMHEFCSGESADCLYCLRNSDVFCYDLRNGESKKLVSLLSLGIVPSEVGAFFAKDDGTLHFLVHDRSMSRDMVGERYLIASPCEIPTERMLVRIGFERVSDGMTEAILAFNQTQKEIFLEAVDYRNAETAPNRENITELIVMDDALYSRLQNERALKDLSILLTNDGDVHRQDFFQSVLNALSDEEGILRRMAGTFYIRSIACDWKTVEGQSKLNLEALRRLLSAMPAGSSLYEPYYTAERLLEDLTAVNRERLGSGDAFDTALYAELLNFSNLQPESYSYSAYSTNTASMEKRIYDGRLLLLQAHIASLEDLKWYDAFFETGASFVGWPTREGSFSRIFFDETVGIAEECPDEIQKACWQFIKTLLSEAYGRGAYGFPVIRENLEKQMTEDQKAVSYRVDEKGKFETDKNGSKIEIARDTWYSTEGRRHFVYALTEAQEERLLMLINTSV